MKIERTKNASRNIAFGLLLKIYQILLPFLIRTAMIYCMGVQYVGLDSLFVSIVQVLNLAELGVGVAMVYSMYRPIAEDDAVSICALMKLYRTYYRVIGGIVAVVGLALTPFIVRLVKSDLPPDVDIYVLYWLNLAATVLSYWLFAYKNSLFQAHQRTDVASRIALATNTVRYLLQLAVVFFWRNYYAFVIVMLATQALTNVITAIAADKMYPDYKPTGALDKTERKNINRRIRDLFTAKLGGVIVNSADTVVISAFLGLTVLAVYQNYYFILTAIIGILLIVFQSCTAGIGNSVLVETKEKNYSDLKKFTFIIAWIAGFVSACLLCLYQPFMEIWMGKDLLLEYSAVICFSVYFFIYEINQLLNTYKDAAGIWHEDRLRPLVTALSNLCLNLVMVQFLGIYGVLLSTVLSMVFVGMPWLLHNLFTTLFEKERMASYLKSLFGYVGVSAVVCSVTAVVCHFIPLNGWAALLVRGVICCVLPNVLFLIVYRRTAELRQAVMLFDNMTKGKLKLAQRMRLG